MKSHIAIVCLLAASSSFASSVSSVKCTTATIKSEPEVQELLMRAYSLLRKQIAQQVLLRGGTVDADSIEISKDEKGFFLNYQTSVTGNAKLTDGTPIMFTGEISHYASKKKKYDSLGNELGTYCEYTGYPEIIISNSSTKRVIGGVLFNLGRVSIKL